MSKGGASSLLNGGGGMVGSLGGNSNGYVSLEMSSGLNPQNDRNLFRVSPARDKCLWQRVSRDPSCAARPFSMEYRVDAQLSPNACAPCCSKGYTGGYNQYFLQTPQSSGMTTPDSSLFYRVDWPGVA